jgi:hypothetical protein
MELPACANPSRTSPSVVYTRELVRQARILTNRRGNNEGKSCQKKWCAVPRRCGAITLGGLTLSEALLPNGAAKAAKVIPAVGGHEGYPSGISRYPTAYLGLRTKPGMLSTPAGKERHLVPIRTGCGGRQETPRTKPSCPLCRLRRTAWRMRFPFAGESLCALLPLAWRLTRGGTKLTATRRACKEPQH